MKVCSVIVTYGDRFYLLKQVIGACYSEGVDKVIVVDNASEKNSRDKLKKFEKEHKDRVKVVYLDENTGSAGGYKRGLEEAYQCKECEYIWLLDDDNQPQKDSLKVLKEFWNGIASDDKIIALLSYREGGLLHKEVINKNDYSLLLGKKNNFLKFHFIEIPMRIYRLIKNKLGFKRKTFIKTYGTLPVAPYGGLFFDKKIIDKIGYPDDKLFLYVDDYDWSYRITNNFNGKIFLLLNSNIKDLDTGWMVEGKASILFSSLLNKGTDFRAYYSVRNKIIFQNRYLVNNPLIYKLNKFLFLFLLKLYVRKNNFHRYKILKEAIYDGLNNITAKKY